MAAGPPRLAKRCNGAAERDAGQGTAAECKRPTDCRADIPNQVGTRGVELSSIDLGAQRQPLHCDLLPLKIRY